MASWAIEVAGRFFPEGLGNFDAHVLVDHWWIPGGSRETPNLSAQKVMI
jgi:hypothetical protein